MTAPDTFFCESKPTLLAFPCPAPLMNMNSRQHWAVKAREARAWRQAAHVVALGLGAPSKRKHPACYVSIELPVNGNRRRDPANYYASLKVCIDGLVDAGIWPDDTPQYVTTTEPTLSTTANVVTITLTPRPT